MNVAILGFGSIGIRHFNLLRSAYPDASFTIYLPSKSAARAQYNPIRHYLTSNLADILNCSLVIDSSPASCHSDHIHYLYENHFNRPVLIEKPLLSTKAECKLASNLSFTDNIYVNYHLRLSEAYQFIYSLASSDTSIPYGPLFEVTTTCFSDLCKWRSTPWSFGNSSSYETGGGVLRELSHELDLCLSLLDEISNFHIYTGFPTLPISVDQNISISGVTVSGIRFNSSLCFSSQHEYRTSIFHFQKATVVWNLLSNTITINSPLPTSLSFQDDRDSMITRIHSLLLNGIPSPFICDFNSGLRVSQLINSVLPL